MPTNSISKIVVNSETHEIIPHRLTDGTNIVDLPPNMGGDKKLVVSAEPISIPNIPTNSGEYRMFCTMENGIVTPKWVYIDNTVHYFDSSAPTVAVLVLYDDGQHAGNLGAVYC